MLKIRRVYDDNERMKKFVDAALAARGISSRTHVEDGALVIEILAKPQELYGFNIVELVNNVNEM